MTVGDVSVVMLVILIRCANQTPSKHCSDSIRVSWISRDNIAWFNGLHTVVSNEQPDVKILTICRNLVRDWS